MKAILEFNLPEEEEEFLVSINGLQWSMIAMDMDQELRKYEKYGHNFKTIDETISFIREKLFESVNLRGLSLD